MPGIPAYPPDWASEIGSMRQRITAALGSAQTRVGYTGGALPGALSVGQALTAAGGLGVTGGAAISGAVTAGSAAVAGALAAGSATVVGAVNAGAATVTGAINAGAVNADDLIGDTLTIGGQVIDAAAIVAMLTPPVGVLTKGGAQNIPNTTLTTVTGLTYTAPRAGYYTVTGAVLWDNDPDGRREANLVIGGDNFPCTSVHASANTPINTPVAATAAMNAGQTATITVWHSAGAGLNVLAGTRLEAIWRRPL